MVDVIPAGEFAILNSDELQKTILRLNRLDVNRERYQDIVPIIRNAIAGIRISVSLTPSTELYFRARVSQFHKPTKIAELAAPPAELVHGFQRCNPPGISMFYSTSKRITALLECGAGIGDKVYLGQWMNQKPAPVNHILSMGDVPESHKDLTVNEHIVHTYFDTLFTRPVHETFSNVYKLTAAVTEVLTTGFASESEQDIRTDQTIGIRYPSVVDIAESYNTAFHADFATERFVLCHAMELTIKEINQKNIKVEITDNAVEFLEGEILWLGNPDAVPMLIEDRKRLPFINTGRSWVIPVWKSRPSSKDIEAMLRE